MRKLLPFVVVAALASCSGNEKTCEALSWFEGSWKQDHGTYSISERWHCSGDSLQGFSHYVSGTDSTLVETLSIRSDQDGLATLSALVEEQNDKRVIRFQETHRSEGQIVFGNNEHDFPQEVAYERKGDSLLARISGKLEGEQKTMWFRYVKE